MVDEPADDRPRLSELTAAELMDRAQKYRDMAQTATTAAQSTSLLRLAWRFEKMAMDRQSGR